jgi:hypothetical protein
VAAVTEETPPLPEAKPDEGPAPVAETPKPKSVKSASTTKSAKRAFKREVNRIRRFFNE